MDERATDKEFIKWAADVKHRDNYVCQICKVRGSKLTSHHLNSWDSFPEDRYNLENGTTLCVKHHEFFHQTYGFGNNTKYQFEEFLQILEKINKIARIK